jgi:hypothetical protein
MSKHFDKLRAKPNKTKAEKIIVATVLANRAGEKLDPKDIESIPDDAEDVEETETVGEPDEKPEPEPEPEPEKESSENAYKPSNHKPKKKSKRNK